MSSPATSSTVHSLDELLLAEFIDWKTETSFFSFAVFGFFQFMEIVQSIL